METDDGLALCCTVLDSTAPAQFTGSLESSDLAALARELAANDWQLRMLINSDGGAGAGTPADRNVILPIAWPRRPPPASASQRPVA